jgi:hypothetical protein
MNHQTVLSRAAAGPPAAAHAILRRHASATARASSVPTEMVSIGRNTDITVARASNLLLMFIS